VNLGFTLENEKMAKVGAKVTMQTKRNVVVDLQHTILE
jgi:hypothetical protein